MEDKKSLAAKKKQPPAPRFSDPTPQEFKERLALERKRHDDLKVKGHKGRAHHKHEGP